MIGVESVKKLLNSIVFTSDDLKVGVISSTHDEETLFIDVIVTFDPYLSNAASERYSEEYAQRLWGINDEIDQALNYFGDMVYLANIEYQPTSTTLYSEVVNTILDNSYEIAYDTVRDVGIKSDAAKMKIVDVEYELYSKTYDPKLVVKYRRNFKLIPPMETQLEISFWSFVGDFVNTDSFTHEIIKVN